MRLPRFCNRWLLFALVVLGIALGMENDYYYTLLNFIGIYTLLVVGLNLLLGYAGQISLGHAGFYGLGAYTTAVLTATLGLPIPLGMAAHAGLSALGAEISRAAHRASGMSTSTRKRFIGKAPLSRCAAVSSTARERCSAA